MARTCVFGKQSLEPGLCGRTTLRQRVPTHGTAPLLPKLRGQFAEFLHHSSPERLGILYLTTCVGLGYGPRGSSLEAFLGSIGLSTSPESAPHQVSGIRGADLPTPRPTLLAAVYHRRGWTTFLRHPIACLLPDQFVEIHQLARRSAGFTELSITGFSMGVLSRVREYQPVVHRLRLSASP